LTDARQMAGLDPAICFGEYGRMGAGTTSQ